MSKEQIEARKAALEAQRDQMLASLNATIGAINECDYWLAQLAAETLKVSAPLEMGKIED